jgi:DNA primase
MARRFPASLLVRLRNEIAMERLVVRLNWPCKHREGVFCFLCPRCGEFLSGVNRRTNLGRCFVCETNFNPIDFVMAATDRDFVSAVEFLLPILGDGT